MTVKTDFNIDKEMFVEYQIGSCDIENWNKGCWNSALPSKQ